MYYTLKDHQGSLTATVHGNTVERLSYDPWGRRRNTTNFGYDNVSHTFDRGYTLHEHYDDFDLINMNGRLYDPILGRMLSPDVVIQDEQNSQAYNRYSSRSVENNKSK
jgi:RHS repeat-associated protein